MFSDINAKTAIDFRKNRAKSRLDIETEIGKRHGQLDAFDMAAIDNSLGGLIIVARTYKTGSSEWIRTLQRCMRHHLGLGAIIAKDFGNQLQYGEISGFMWQALLRLPKEWDDRKGQATTCLKAITKSIIYDHLYHTHYVGAVRTPLRSKRFSGVSIADDREYESMLYSTGCLNRDEV